MRQIIFLVCFFVWFVGAIVHFMRGRKRRRYVDAYDAMTWSVLWPLLLFVQFWGYFESWYKVREERGVVSDPGARVYVPPTQEMRVSPEKALDHREAQLEAELAELRAERKRRYTIDD